MTEFPEGTKQYAALAWVLGLDGKKSDNQILQVTGRIIVKFKEEKSMNSDIDILRICLTTQGALAPVVVGPPGIGKSQRIRNLAADLDLECEVLSPGERGEGAFGVVPVPNGDGYLHYPAPDWVKKFAESGKGLIFVDEINTAPPALQPALLGLILDGRIGGYQFPSGVRRVAAMNPTSQAASGWDLPAALANRMQYLTWQAPSAAQWGDWLLESAVVSEENSTPGWTKARSLAVAYHRKNPSRLIEDADKVLAERFPPAFCTPRSWETAVRMFASCIDAGKEEIYPLIAEGIIGKPAALEWCTWLRKNDLPDPEILLASPNSWKPDVREQDKVFATCFAVAEAACSDGYGTNKFTKKIRGERWLAAWHVLGRAIDLGKGIIVIAARRLCKVANRPEVAFDKETRRIILSLEEVLQSSGILEVMK